MAQPSTLRSNFINLYFDVFWWGVLAGSTLAFLSVYAARIGATSSQISLISGGPAVVSLLMSLPAARWLEGRTLVQTTFNLSLVHRIGYIALIPLPWLFTQLAEPWAIIAISLLMAVPGAVLSISFNSMFAEVVPPQYRAEVVGRRNALLAVSMTATTFLCGLLLDNLPLPLNYQILFGIGAMGAGMSSYHLWRIRALGPAAPAEAAPAPAARSSVARLDLLRSPFGLLILSYVCFYTSQHAPIPINPLFWVDELKLTDGEIGAGNGMFYATMAAASLMLPRLTSRYSNRQILVVSGILYSLYPFIIALATDSTLFWVASLSGGFVLGVCNAGLLNRLMERVPADDRPAHMAWHNIALNFGILAGSLLGAGLADWIGLRNGMMATAALRFLSGLALLLWA